MAAPTKEEKIAIENRNKEIFEMVEKGFPRSYICSYYKLSKGRLSIIIKTMKEEKSKVDNNKTKTTDHNL